MTSHPSHLHAVDEDGPAPDSPLADPLSPKPAPLPTSPRFSRLERWLTPDRKASMADDDDPPFVERRSFSENVRARAGSSVSHWNHMVVEKAQVAKVRLASASREFEQNTE
eukprot:523797-Prymnesium_polylepis.1